MGSARWTGAAGGSCPSESVYVLECSKHGHHAEANDYQCPIENLPELPVAFPTRKLSDAMSVFCVTHPGRRSPERLLGACNDTARCCTAQGQDENHRNYEWDVSLEGISE